MNSLIDHVVHTAAGLRQRGGDDGEASAVFDLARGAEEALRLMQRAGIHAAGKRSSGRRYGQVVCARKACQAVQQNDHVFAHFNQAHRTFLNHLGYARMVLRQFVECGIQLLSLMERCMSVTSSGRSSMRRTMRWESG